MRTIKFTLATLLLFAFVALPTSVVAQSAQCETEEQCEDIQEPQIILSGIQAEGKGVIIGTTFDPLSESDFRIEYFVGGAFGDGCFQTEGAYIGDYESTTPLANQAVLLEGVDPAELVGKCVYARAFIFFFESEVGPSNQVQLIIENQQPAIGPSQGVLGASTTTSTPQVKAAVLAETGNEFALIALFAGLSIVMFALSLNLSRP